MTIEGTGRLLRPMAEHPYIGQRPLQKKAIEERIFALNEGRDGYKGDAIETTYYISGRTGDGEFATIQKAVHMMLIHGTTEGWSEPGPKPEGYDARMSTLKSIELLGINRDQGMEAALVTISTPLAFFDQSESGVPLAQLRMATAVEPFNAFSDYTARVVDYVFPPAFQKKFLGQIWPHKRIREYLQLDGGEPILGTIVKPKWLPREHFAHYVLECADAGALFVKSDENLHLSKKDLASYVSRTVALLEENGYDVSFSGSTRKQRFLFAMHVTANAFDIVERAKIAVDAGANCLMFSPHLSGDFEVIRQIYDLGEKYEVPVFSHCAGMNRFTGDPNYSFGEDPRTVYLLAALSGVAFMQLPAARGYIRPTDVEKMPIVQRLSREGLEGENGMTLVIAGGLSAANIGHNINVFGDEGKLFLAGTSVSHHPDGTAAGFAAIKLAAAAASNGIVEKDALRAHAQSLGKEGLPLARVLVE